jgi:hypothetical protein
MYHECDAVSIDAPLSLPLSQYLLCQQEKALMLKIEVWKCKPAWASRLQDDQNLMLRHLTTAVQRSLDDPGKVDAGPFLVQKPGTCLLIWTWEVNHPEVVRVMEQVELDKHFERLVDVMASSKLTARQLADRLR